LIERIIVLKIYNLNIIIYFIINEMQISDCFLLGIIFGRMEVKAADVTDSTVRILIGDGTKSRHHITLTPGVENNDKIGELQKFICLFLNSFQIM